MAGITKREQSIRHTVQSVARIEKLTPGRADKAVRAAAVAIDRMSNVRRRALFLLLLERVR